MKYIVYMMKLIIIIFLKIFQICYNDLNSYSNLVSSLEFNTNYKGKHIVLFVPKVNQVYQIYSCRNNINV